LTRSLSPSAIAASLLFAACVNLTPRWEGRNDAGDMGGRLASDAATGGSGGTGGNTVTGDTTAGGTELGGVGGFLATGGMTAAASGGAGGLPATGGTTATATGGTGRLLATGGTSGLPTTAGTTAPTTGIGGSLTTGGSSGTATDGAAGNVERDAGSVGGSSREGGIDVPPSVDTNRPVDQGTGGTSKGGATTDGTGGTVTGGTGGTVVPDAGTVADTALPPDSAIDVPVDTSPPPDLATGGTGGTGTGGTGGIGVDAAVVPTIVSIDFVGGAPPSDSGTNGTVAMGASESAGAKPATNWNSAAGSAGTLSSLKLADGTTSSASVTWSAAGTWSLYLTDAPGDARMMNGYLDPMAPASPATVTVRGLASPMSSGYDVYVYCYGDIYLVQTRTFQYAIGSTTHSVSEAGISVHTFPGYTQVTSEGGTGNYVVFHNVTGTSFTLTATPGTPTGSQRAPVNGIQIVYPPGS